MARGASVFREEKQKHTREIRGRHESDECVDGWMVRSSKILTSTIDVRNRVCDNTFVEVRIMNVK